MRFYLRHVPTTIKFADGPSRGRAIQEPKEDSKAPEYPYLETMAEFDAAIEASKDRPLLIDFTAEWCPPCKYIGPIYDDYIE